MKPLPYKPKILFPFLLFVCWPLLGPAENENRGRLHSFDGDYILYFTPPNGLSLISPTSSPSISSIETHLPNIDFLNFNSSRVLLAGSGKELGFHLPSRNFALGKKESLDEPAKLVQTYPFSEDFFVATDSVLYRFNPHEKKPSVFYKSENEASGIGAFSVLRDGTLILAQANGWDILLIPPDIAQTESRLIHHRSAVLSLTNDGEGYFYAVDGEGNLSVWSPPYEEPVHTFEGGKLTGGRGIVSSVFDYRSKKLILRLDLQEEFNSIALNAFDLNSGILRKSSAKTLPLNQTQILQVGGSPGEEIYPAPEKPPSTDFIELAKLETDLGNYQKALDFIGKIPEYSTDYPEGRKLSGKIYRLRNSESSAQQGELKFRAGKTEEAKFLFEKALEWNPENQRALEYLRRLKKEEIGESSDHWLLVSVLAILLGVVWFYRQKFLALSKRPQKAKPDLANGPGAVRKNDKPKPDKQAVPKKPPIDLRQNEGKKETGKERVRFQKVLNVTLSILENTKSLDRDHLFASSWKTIHSEIRDIGNKASASNADFGSLIIMLNQIQKSVAELQRTLLQKYSQDAKESSQHEPPDYYQILGIRPEADAVEIKKAFRQKMQEYHPDKHRNADFEWIKKESEKQTQSIQRAFKILSDKTSRHEYDQRRKKRTK